MSHRIRTEAVQFQNKVERKTNNQELIFLAKKIRHLIHDMKFREARDVLQEFERKLPDDDDAYYLREIARDLRSFLEKFFGFLRGD